MLASGIALVVLVGAFSPLLFVLWNQSPRDQKITVGGIEQVILLPWGMRVPARIDTGAATSSLDAREIKASKKDQEVEFKLPSQYGGYPVRRHIVAWQTVKSSNGQSERRPVVQMEICIGPRRITTDVTLNDRSRMEFPLLIGRNTLTGVFLVDVTVQNGAPPEWAGDATQPQDLPATTQEAPGR